ncbi:hypothetical protein EVB94_342 [Rhizobium phage RHph_TM40]|uniref:I-spanin n=2 Tax=Cuauhnahuacvirus TaxID=3044696 RepID=A0A7S5UXH7_9CAUD|nr:hypothetical protein PQC16_gp319 [Rhizobium phage RHph_TM30]YP_010671470.1 hypothetical protein PQC17_gp320 [Rhizobium phage RHph_Y65]QIG71793.1 hypothetical protein EVB94_342 [Rhizobium phage RHph_TM40]QIG72154.1 hypothetical protein EVB95_340 [Rhizobium phage RHph_TM2_3B]QIG72516.1 hypothetical protein EVB96_340 [Rhizobium phage RHph_TM3_3_6]QIG71429.1 hypothetical protein EVB93_342 [Rhizobium phage RHph_TM30]QIG72879.1 hypothetical protein EVB97_341 [Rhizobium phage RHph_Y65]
MSILATLLTNNLTKIIGLFVVAILGLYLYYCHIEIKSLKTQLVNSAMTIEIKDEAIKQWQNSYNQMSEVVTLNNEKISALEANKRDLMKNLEDSETVINKKDIEHNHLLSELSSAVIGNSCQESMKWLKEEGNKLGNKWESGQ